MTTKARIAANFIRSAVAPTISAGAMQAKAIWKTTKAYSGMKTPAEKDSAIELVVTPFRNILDSPPMKGVSGPASSALPAPVKASE